MINKETKEWAPIPEFLNVPGLVKDIQKITDSGRGKKFSNFMLAMGVLKNYRPFKAPKSLAISLIRAGRLVNSSEPRSNAPTVAGRIPST